MIYAIRFRGLPVNRLCTYIEADTSEEAMKKYFKGMNIAILDSELCKFSLCKSAESKWNVSLTDIYI